MTDWAKIQIEYEQGITPKDLAKKYNLTPKQISQKAHNANWKKPKDIQSKTVEKNRKKYEEKIKNLFCKSIIELDKIIDDPETRTNDKINAIKCVIDVSGYKKESQDVNLTPQIVVADESHKNILEQIRNVDIN